MNSDRLAKAKLLLESVVGKSPEERERLLRDECSGEELRVLVEALLHEQDERARASQLATAPETQSKESRGAYARTNRYRILEKIGEGAFGEVFVAEQSVPVRRRVAMKILKAGLDTKAVLARFEAERQALALMDHPCIAKVFDAGETDSGRPFFVMEHVQGVAITAHCDRNLLTTRERLELFLHVCAGVQHAHQKAVIHRDIKPSNVLVTIQDEKANPKIIDFGVAKATSQPLTERTLFTEMGQLIGTPSYMSPEQAEMTGQNIDTRTDVYSLGVMLYELLVGALPFDSKELRAAGLEGIRKTIREVDPPRPSTRVSSLGEESTASARSRRTTPMNLSGQLRGDLDWITMKALEKDRTRRYGSPSDLAADIERHLKHEPVFAGPPTMRYRMTKFIRRHRIGVALAAAAAVSILGFAARERIHSGRIARQAVLITEERDRASREAETARQVSEFMTGLFEVSDPSEAKGTSITAREILDRGVKKIDESLESQPEVRARLMVTMGSVYLNLGLYERAEELIEQALTIRRSVLGEEHPETLTCLTALANLSFEKGQYDRAEELFVETLEARRRVMGAEHTETLKSMVGLATTYKNQGRYDEAEPLYVEALAIQRRTLGDESIETLRTMNNLANLYFSEGRYEKAQALHAETLQITRRVLGDEHPLTLKAMHNLGGDFWGQELYEEAEQLFSEALEIKRRVFGSEHLTTLQTMTNLAAVYTALGRYEEAQPVHEETVDIMRRVLGPEHLETLGAVNNLADLYYQRGRHDDAESLFVETLEIQQRVLGKGHPDTQLTLYNLALVMAATGRGERALAYLRQAVDSGFSQNWMMEDAEFESLRRHPEFEAIVEEVKRRNERRSHRS